MIGMTMAEFEIYQSLQNPTHYVAVLSSDVSENAEGVRHSQNLTPLTRIAEDGQPHLGFDPSLAKAAIAEHGFYAFALTVEPRDGID
jgi:hypothetical protein